MNTKTKLEPINKTMTVARGQKETFEFFTARVNDWWPRRTHSIGGEKSARVDFEPRKGGRLFETLDDGTEKQWGKVLTWDAPDRLVFSWHLSRPEDQATEVEVTFTALSDDECRDLDDPYMSHKIRRGNKRDRLPGSFKKKVGQLDIRHMCINDQLISLSPLCVIFRCGTLYLLGPAKVSLYLLQVVYTLSPSGHSQIIT